MKEKTDKELKDRADKADAKLDRVFNPGWVNPSDPMGTDPNAPVGD